MEYKKLLGVAGLVTLVATTSVAYMSKNDDIQNKINQLYNIADGFKNDLSNSQGQNSEAQQQLTEKQAILEGIAGELGTEDTTLNGLTNALSTKLANRQKEAYNEVALEIGMPQKTLPDFYTAQDIKDWVDNQSQTERDTIATNLGLPAKEGGYTADDIVTAMQTKIEQDKQAKINDLAKAVGLPNKDGGYTEETFVAEVKQYIDEVNELQKLVGNTDLVAKVKKMIADLEQANQEEQAQLETAKNKIKALGYCPEHDSLVQLSSDGTCPTCSGGQINPPEGTPVEPEEPEEETGGIDSARLAEFEQVLRANANGISDNAVNALVNDHDNYRLHKNGYVVKKNSDGTWGYNSGYSGNLPTRTSTAWTNIKNAYIAVFGEADFMQ